MFKWAVGLFLFIAVLGVTLNMIGFFAGAANNAITVAKKEFYPDALLRKYEWFKDASAALDAKAADMRVYDNRLATLKQQYAGSTRAQWARDDREQYSIWASEAAGVRASYNSLAAEYNSEMSKFNVAFMNAGGMPQGGKPLPREYRSYQEE